MWVEVLLGWGCWGTDFLFEKRLQAAPYAVDDPSPGLNEGPYSLPLTYPAEYLTPFTSQLTIPGKQQVVQ